MNDERQRLRCYMPLVLAIMLGLALPAPLRAREILEASMTPWLDPLLSMPPDLFAATALPGDVEPVICTDQGQTHVAASVTEKPLSLSDAVNLALCHHPQIQAAWASVQLQAAQVGSARAAYLPKLTAGISRASQNTTYSGSQAMPDSDTTRDSRYLSLTWRLLDSGTRAAQHGAASALFDAAVAGHHAALQKALTQVIAAYYEVQINGASRQAKLKGEALARQTLATALQRESRGIGAHADSLQAQTALARAELDSSRAAGAYAKAHATLMVAMGLPVLLTAMPEWTPVADDGQDVGQERGQIHELLYQDLASWLAAAQYQHPALLAARAQLTAERQQLVAARAEGLPTLDLSLGRYRNGRPGQGLSSAQSYESSIGLALTIPLFDGFANTYKVRSAQAQIALREAALRETESQISSDIVKAHADAVSAVRNLQAARKLVDIATQALLDVRARYDKGLVDILAMLSVQAALADAEQERIRALAEWSSARLRLVANAGLAGVKDLRD